MEQKISAGVESKLFSKALFLSNIKRFFFLPLIHFIAMVLAGPVILNVELNDRLRGFGYGPRPIEVIMRNEVRSDIALLCFPPYYFFVAFIMMFAVFSYLYFPKSSYMMHSFPVSRKSMFFTNVLSGFAMVVIPSLAATLITAAVATKAGPEAVTDVFSVFVLGVMSTTFFSGVAIFVIMCTGAIVAAPALYAIINFLEIYLAAMVTELGRSFTPEVSVNSPSSFFTPIVWASSMMSRDLFWNNYNSEFGFKPVLEEPGYYIGMAIVGVVFLIFAYLVYSKKHVESAGSLLPMRWTRPIFRWGVAFCAGGLAALFFSALIIRTNSSGGTLLVYMASFAVTGFIVFFGTQMLIERSFRVFSRRRLAEVLIMCTAFVAFSIGLSMDATGMSRKVPDIAKVESVRVSGAGIDMRLEDEEAQEIIAIHRELIKNRSEIMNNWYYYGNDSDYTSYNINIDYTLEGGYSLGRYYFVRYFDDSSPLNNIKEELDKLLNDPKVVEKYLLREDNGEEIERIYYYSFEDKFAYEEDPPVKPAEWRGPGGECFTEEKKSIQILKNAILEDVKAGNIKIFSVSEVPEDNIGNLEIMFTNKDEKGYISNSRYAYLNINSRCVNVLKALKEADMEYY